MGKTAVSAVPGIGIKGDPDRSAREQRMAAAAAITTVVLWASAFVGIRAAGHILSAGPLSLGRLLAGSLALGLLVVLRRDPLPARRDLRGVIICALLWFGAYNVLLNQAERVLDAGTAAMLVNVGPLFIAVLSGLLLNEGFPRRVLVGCAIAFAGTVIIGVATSTRGLPAGFGTLLCVAAAATYAGGVTAEKPVLARNSALTVTWLACSIGAISCLPFAPQLVQEVAHAGAGTVALVIYLGVFPTALGFSLWGYALARTSAGRMGATTYLVTPIAIVMGWLLLGDVPPGLALVGGLISLAGVAVTRGARLPGVSLLARRWFSDYSQRMEEAVLAQVRRFNRIVTQRVGALNDRFLARDRSIGEARLLWEVGAEGCDVCSLRSRLELDSGYLSRLLRSLEAAGLLTVGPKESDRRVRIARLTPAGSAERAVLDQRSDELAASLLAPLSATQRTRLVAAMADVELLLTAAMVEVAPIDPAHPDAQYCLRSYFAELDRRFDTGFDPALGLPVDEANLRPPAGLFLVASLRADPIGCGALRFHGQAPAEIKRMWIAESARGLGIGRRLLGELENRAAEHGARAVRLETNRALTEAISLYRSAGYTEVAPFNDEAYAHHWFEKVSTST